MTAVRPSSLEYFSGGVPTGEYFRGTLNDIREISLAHSTTQESATGESRISRLHEICFVGAVSYFEAFCKDHFASIINIEPSIVRQFKAAGQDVMIDGSVVAHYGSKISYRLGFVVAERLDFGTAQKINALYTALLKLTPFSKQEAQTYARILGDRNLLVHHGGTYTMSYVMTHPSFQGQERERTPFRDSRVVNHQDVTEVVTFLECIAKKMTFASRKALLHYLDSAGITCNDQRKEAIDYMDWWDNEGGPWGRERKDHPGAG